MSDVTKSETGDSTATILTSSSAVAERWRCRVCQFSCEI